MTSLTDKKIRFLCRHIVDLKDWSVGDIAIQYEVTERRVRQLTREYRETGKVPTLDRSRRPRGPPLTKDERRAIDEVWEDKRFGARLLHRELARRGVSIPRHKIHRYLVEKGRSIPNPKKQRKRRRCRYERKHSFSLVQGDWHRTTEDHPHALVWQDDASRLLLAGGEYDSRSGEMVLERLVVPRALPHEPLHPVFVEAHAYRNAVHVLSFSRSEEATVVHVRGHPSVPPPGPAPAVLAGGQHFPVVGEEAVLVQFPVS